MIKQVFNDNLLEKKHKILRTSIILGTYKDKNEILDEYYKNSIEIDKIKNNVYEELLSSKMYSTTTLEDELYRLKELINLVQNRMQERNDFQDDYMKVTSSFLDDLPVISKEEELNSFKLRCDNIENYLNNSEKIKSLNEELLNLKDDLEKKYQLKVDSEEVNSKLEDELIHEFDNVINEDKYYSELNYTDIDNEILSIDNNINEKKTVLDTFNSSYDALLKAGICGSEKEEYSSYVQDARCDYYQELEKKYILTIYKIILDKVKDYKSLNEKRNKIASIIKERASKRLELFINKRDILNNFIDLNNKHLNVIRSEKKVIDDIDSILVEVSRKEDELKELELQNSRKEITDLLNEFSVDKIKIEKIELPKEEEFVKENVNEFKYKHAPNNMVINVKDPIKMNVKTAADTAKLVMKKVVIVLEPKKFNGKKEKILEEEKELLDRKKKEELTQKEEVEETKEDTISKENNLFELDNIIINDEVDSNKDNTINEVEDNKEDILVNLDTQEANDKDVKEVKEVDNLKINLDKDASIPTEIFIEDSEDTKEEIKSKENLFNENDPFLDDNEFEIEKKKPVLSDDYDIPVIGNIGSVRPNSVLQDIKDVQEETSDIILPTMGLTENEKEEVPIVSENYIN